MSIDLQRMIREVPKAGLRNAFPTIHHFASSRFRSRAYDFDPFVEYCETRDLKDDGENPQTIRRALAACRNVERGMKPAAAIAAAWAEFPLVTR